MTPAFGRRGTDGERSAAEREAARLERERRRAEREGRPLPEEPAVEERAEASPPEPPTAAGSPEPADEPFGWEDEPEPAHSNGSTSWSSPAPAPAPMPAPEPAPRERDEHAGAWHDDGEGRVPDESRADAERATAWQDEPEGRVPGDPGATASAEPAAPQRRTVSLPRPQTDDQDTDGWDAPIGTVRVSRGAAGAGAGGGGGAGGGYQAQPGASGYPPYRKLGVSKRRRWWRRIVPALVLLVLVAGTAFAYLLFQPLHGEGHGAVAVRVPEGAGATQIGDLLADRGVISSGFFFALRARLSGQRSELRSGRYTLKQDMTYAGALTALTTPPKAAPVIDVALPEGPSRRELARRVEQAGVRGDYLRATRRSSKLSLRDYGAPRGTSTLEGFLFPATYELRRSEATTGRLVSRQIDAFKENFARVDLGRARARNLSRYDVLIIASMIEREASVARDRRLISAVVYNRLREGIPLGIDATIRYALNNWSRPLRQSELASDSAFNTRRRRGLPPTPIGNPGLAAMRAAANPASVDYLFYVVRPCGNGAHAFSSTDAEFQRDVAAYNRARERRGGRDPSRC